MSIAPSPSLASSELGSAGFDVWNYLLVCGLVLGLLVGAAYLLRRFVAGNVRRRAAERSLRVVDVLPLHGRVKLVVVRCYDRSFLLGLGDKEISSIAELDVEEPGRAADEPRAQAAEPFGAALARAARGGGVIDPRPRPRASEPAPAWREEQGVFG